MKFGAESPSLLFLYGGSYRGNLPYPICPFCQPTQLNGEEANEYRKTVCSCLAVMFPYVLTGCRPAYGSGANGSVAGHGSRPFGRTDCRCPNHGNRQCDQHSV